MLEAEQIKKAFIKVKEDIFSLQSQILVFRREIDELKRTLEQIKNQTIKAQNQTNQQVIQTDDSFLNALKSPNLRVSIGNGGVPTDRQTNQQTIQHPQISNEKFVLNNRNKPADKIERLQQITQVLNSLDELKKEIRAKFKRLTKQEMTIFTAIYQLEELGIEVTYNLIAEKLNLSEISVRDYVRKIIKKGVPIGKLKTENNKVILSISKELKQIASLSTIMNLREL